MCGRYTLLASEEEIAQAFGIQQSIDSYQISYNIAPGQNVLAVIHDGKEKRAGYLRWGLVPSWAEDEKIGYKMINARSETAHEKASFKKLVARKRCLIVADSFYEWRKTDKKKQPKRIHLTDRKLFAFAGLWDKWQQNDKVLFTCTILTKAANDFMQDIHHRMPIILPKDKEDAWIFPEEKKPRDMHNFLQNVEAEELSAYDVASYVNAAKNNDETCIAPLI
ncbi:SOS response-associated peptidase [Virgibacillus oceani]|uniref:Abasic site processing protein n=1 Tax=Virgibacillus oceani TaxID=1479511 RepID=A0A917HCE2_9BACI|nr:SOS response-associated peptidase [Virgibacillus oceani]GGG74765.1 putative SOS response-associated peptidase YoqW [Virgibacillus oceani]